MNNPTLRPLSKRELDRIEYYCHRLSLNRWDINDIKAYFIAMRNISMLVPSFEYVYVNATEEFKKAKNKMFDLGLMNVADEFTKYLMHEPKLFNDNKIKYPNMSDEENWTLVYKHIEQMISEEITRAKESAKAASGCAFTLILLILVPISIAITIKSLFFV